MSCSLCNGHGVIQMSGRGMRYETCTKCGGAPVLNPLKDNKFHAEATTRGATKFASKREALRYDELCNLELAGKIKYLQVHPRYPLQSKDGSVTIRYPNGRLAVYTADFQYEEQNDDDTETVVTEDVKSKPTMTEASTLRMAVFSSLYGREVRITK